MSYNNELQEYRDLLHELYMFLQYAREAKASFDIDTYTEYMICAAEVQDDINAFELAYNDKYKDFSNRLN